MKKSLFLSFACFSCACLILSSVAGCQKTEIPPVDEPEEPYINVSPDGLSFGTRSEDDVLLTIETNGGWTADIAEDWVTIERVNDMTLRVDVLENGLEEPQRTALLNIVPDNGADTVGVEITQAAGYTIDGNWHVLHAENSTDLINWSFGGDYKALEQYLLIDLENMTMRMKMKNPYTGEAVDKLIELIYEPDDLALTLISEDETAVYTIYEVTDNTFELYCWSDLSKAYAKLVCERVAE